VSEFELASEAAPSSLRCTLMRGGTSKAVFLRAEDLPADPQARRRLILAVFGSPDPRQIDGLGGADPLTSKLAIIGAPDPAEPAHAGADVVYTFAQVGIETDHVDYASPCGNILSAVGPYAVLKRLVAAREPVTRVRVFNTNLQRQVVVEVPVRDGSPRLDGDYGVAGVPGTGARIGVDLAGTAGAVTGRLLPGGRPLETMRLPDDSDIAASLVDIGNPHVFVRAADLGLAGSETAARFAGDPALLARLAAIRGEAAVRFGLATSAATADAESPVTPLLAIVAAPARHQTAGGVVVDEAAHNLIGRVVFLNGLHPSFAATSIVCTGVAARLPGTVVADVARLSDGPVRIAHPAGIVEADVVVGMATGVPVVEKAAYGRTARRLMDGLAYLPDCSEARRCDRERREDR